MQLADQMHRTQILKSNHLNPIQRLYLKSVSFHIVALLPTLRYLARKFNVSNWNQLKRMQLLINLRIIAEPSAEIEMWILDVFVVDWVIDYNLEFADHTL